MGTIVALSIGLVTLCKYFPIKTKNTNSIVLGICSKCHPYGMLDSDGSIIGFDVDLAKIVAEEMGVKLVIKDMPFKSLIKELKSGHVDMIMSGLSITRKRYRDIDFIPYDGDILDHLALVFCGSLPPGISPVLDLKTCLNKKVCVCSDTYLEKLASELDFIKIKRFSNTAEMLVDVKNGKSIAAILDPRNTMQLQLSQPDMKILNVPLSADQQTFGIGIGINKRQMSLALRLSQIISVLNCDGTISKLKAKWLHGCKC